VAEGGERTEAATQRRLDTAREAGQVPLSREALGVAVLGSAGLVLVTLAPPALGGAVRSLGALVAQADRLTPGQAAHIAVGAAIGVAAPFALAALAAGSAAVLLQTGFLINLGALRPDLSRLDPRRGLRRIAGPETLLETGKSLLKMTIVGFAGWRAVIAILPALPGATEWDPGNLVRGAEAQVMHLLIAMLASQAALAALDILRARFQHARGLRMSRQEIREEHRDSDGDPQIKAKRRMIQRQRSRRRMLAAVPRATVVITNPTHYAVALAYDRAAGGGAPRVIAKGIDEVAARIREVAAAHRIPLVANPPLARALHQVDLDGEIPAEHYKAVAEIIAYVWRLRGRAAPRARKAAA
jgi:flagellar biosynthetic protein FlhB